MLRRAGDGGLDTHLLDLRLARSGASAHDERRTGGAPTCSIRDGQANSRTTGRWSMTDENAEQFAAAIRGVIDGARRRIVPARRLL